jgi:hypothetical protein
MDDVYISMDGDSPRPARIHRMQVLRMRLLYFANSLHNYIMTRVCLITKLFILPKIIKKKLIMFIFSRFKIKKKRFYY